MALSLCIMVVALGWLIHRRVLTWALQPTLRFWHMGRRLRRDVLLPGGESATCSVRKGCVS